MESLKGYERFTFQTLAAIYKSKLLLDLSLESFHAFPENFHPRVIAPLNEAVAFSIKERNAVVSGRTLEEERDDNIIKGDKILNNAVFLKRINERGDIDDLSELTFFNQQILEQNLVYFVALIESYMHHSAEFIYKHKSEYLEKKKDREWAQNSFSGRLNKLNDRFGINLGFEQNLLSLFDEFDLLRNCILHNGSKVSPRYHDKFKEIREINLGDPIELSKYFLNAVYYLSSDFVELLFIETSNLVQDKNGALMAKLSLSITPAGFNKDYMTKKGNWMHTELTENGVM